MTNALKTGLYTIRSKINNLSVGIHPMEDRSPLPKRLYALRQAPQDRIVSHPHHHHHHRHHRHCHHHKSKKKKKTELLTYHILTILNYGVIVPGDRDKRRICH